MTLGFQDQKATTSRVQDKKPQHRDSKAFFQRTKSHDIEIPRLKKPRHRISAEFWPLSSMIIGRAELSGSRRFSMLYKIGFPEIFVKFTEISVLESFFDKAAVLHDCSFVKKRLRWTEHYRTLFLLISPFHTSFDPLITLLSFAPWFFCFIYSCKHSS